MRLEGLARYRHALLVALVLAARFALMVGNAMLVFGAPVDVAAEQITRSGSAESRLNRIEEQMAGRQASDLFLEYLQTIIETR